MCVQRRISLALVILGVGAGVQMIAAQSLSEEEALLRLQESPRVAALQAQVEFSRAEARIDTLVENPSVHGSSS